MGSPSDAWAGLGTRPATNDGSDDEKVARWRMKVYLIGRQSYRDSGKVSSMWTFIFYRMYAASVENLGDPSCLTVEQYCCRPCLTKLGTISDGGHPLLPPFFKIQNKGSFNISFSIRLNSLSNRMEGRWPNKVLSYKGIKKEENRHYRGWLTSSPLERVVCVHLPSSNFVLSRNSFDIRY